MDGQTGERGTAWEVGEIVRVGEETKLGKREREGEWMEDGCSRHTQHPHERLEGQPVFHGKLRMSHRQKEDRLGR